MLTDTESSGSVSKRTREKNPTKHVLKNNVIINKLQKEKERLIQQLKNKTDDEKLDALERRYAEKKKSSRKNSDDYEMDSNDEDEYDSEYEEEDEEEDEEDKKLQNAFTFSFGGMDDGEKNIPKRHDMKKETDDVKAFVKLITTPSDEDTIDGQIDQFKARLSNISLPSYMQIEEHIFQHIDEIAKTIYYKEKSLKLLTELKNQLSSILSHYSKEYLLKHKLMPSYR
jgi:hypothetical protein